MGSHRDKRKGGRVDLRSLIGEPRDRHPHPSGASKSSDENEEICLVAWEALTNRLGDGDKENTRYRVADKCGDDLHQIVAVK